MCLTLPATVLEIRNDCLVVEVDGQPRLVDNLLVPDARVGDDVLVGLGRALAVLPPVEAAKLRELLVPIAPTLDRV
jgi:hydrogenase expression/formation protein HypC